MKVIGISASSRNIRHGTGSDVLIEEIKKIQTREHLSEYLTNQAQLCVSAFIDAGRMKYKFFNKIHRNLRNLPGTYGLSNSEILLAAGLWGAKTNKVEIEHVNLLDYFRDKQYKSSKFITLLEKVSGAEGILLSGPVYFGDRSSIAHDFLQVLRKNPGIVRDKFFAGLTVGAKRNGGQETCLIYQLIDFINIDMLGVGNDSGTTAQYGGTGHAGDVGTGDRDEYGINTSIGTGNRIAQVSKLKEYSKNYKLKGKPTIGIIILQDVKEQAKHFVEKHFLNSELADRADFRFFYFVKESVRRCIACDSCPKTIGDDEIYRCIIRAKEDLFVKYHKEIIQLDAILLGGYSPESYSNISSIYQAFMERTRYIRRSDYIFSNCLVAPLVFQEIGSRENLHMRILTSMIRHHTILHKPIIFYVQNKRLIYFNDSYKDLNNFIVKASSFTAGRILYYSNEESYSNYVPLGYTLKTERDREPINVQKRKENIEERRRKFREMLQDRIQK
jgi:multimeric flavodoxin WrbA